MTCDRVYWAGQRLIFASRQKPGCKAEVLEYFRKNPDTGVTSPNQIAVVGDRLFTDVMMANLMGSYGFWIKDGVEIEKKSFVSTAQMVGKALPNFNCSLRVWRIEWLASC
jgi:ribonucleotide monophosphatase NagD (HAD superfamily)